MDILNFLSVKGGDRHITEINRASSTLFPKQRHAIVSVDIHPNSLGRIRYQATDWFGCSLNDIYIPKGTVVEVLECRDNTWLVTPAVNSFNYLAAYRAAELN